MSKLYAHMHCLWSEGRVNLRADTYSGLLSEEELVWQRYFFGIIICALSHLLKHKQLYKKFFWASAFSAYYIFMWNVGHLPLMSYY